MQGTEGGPEFERQPWNCATERIRVRNRPVVSESAGCTDAVWQPRLEAMIQGLLARESESLSTGPTPLHRDGQSVRFGAVSPTRRPDWPKHHWHGMGPGAGISPPHRD
jgi:hypothetical protein